jgi:rhomboid family protein
MIPIGDEPGRRHTFPIVMVSLLAINILVFLYQLTLPEPALRSFFLRAGVVPIELATGRDLPPVDLVPVWGTVVTSMFIHGGFLHLASNMLYLWVFGDNVEDRLGHLRFLLFYLLSGTLAALTQVFINPESRIPLVGASGAIAGVLAGYLVLFPHAQIRTLLILGFFITVPRLPAILLIGFWIILQFFSGVASLGVQTAATGGVAYWAHIGGFIAGLVLIVIFPKRRLPSRWSG